MELRNLTENKNLNLFTEDDVKNIDDIREKISDYFEKGEDIESEIRRAKVSNSPSFENSIENIKDTIQESVLADKAKNTVDKFSKTDIGRKVMKKLEKPLETIKNIVVNVGKFAYKLGKMVIVK